MASTLNTKIALLYRSYESWTTDEQWMNYVAMKGEVCFCPVPAASHVVTQEPCVLFKVGDGVLDTETGTVTGTAFKDLPWASALAADVADWAKKTVPDFSDLDLTYKQALIEYVKQYVTTTDTLYKLIEGDKEGDDVVQWKLMKSTDKGATWLVSEGEVNIKAVVTRMNDLQASVESIQSEFDDIRERFDEIDTRTADYGGAMTEQEVRDATPIED